MNIQLMHGDFSASESLGLITKMIHLEIKFYEDKIQKENNINAIKKNEETIKQLQKDLYNARKIIEKQDGKIKLNGHIALNE
jgi:hypothetical protein